MADEDYYKREQDQKWRDEVNSRLVSLTASQKNTDDDIDELAGKIEELDELLHGDRKERDSGLVGQLNAVDTGLNSILRVLHPDSTGHGGLFNEHKEIKRKILGSERSTEYHWKFGTALVVAILSVIGLLIQNWGQIASYWDTNSKEMKIMEKKIEKGKHPHVKRYVPKVKIVPPEELEVQQ